ncbi:hypothetical protein F7725_022447 [Dissostichus mawsoni]|uniref:Uncharacterized protein n=1 Tax=Dissostichus mawsoni TaxID=36200 RepID=A0A7J5YXU4_DISMA|nr:hypothetical protein F7725_022447 [Dissostichus mawsoni]
MHPSFICPVRSPAHQARLTWKEGSFKTDQVHHTCLQALGDGLDPVVSEHHRLRQAEVELLLQGQNRSMGTGKREQILQQLHELLLRMV